MKIEKGKLYAVITGDIVGFSKLPSEKRQTLSRIMKMGSEALQKSKYTIDILGWTARKESSRVSYPGIRFGCFY